MKAILIAAVILIAGLATWRIIAGRVDLTKPEAVAAAFTSALKSKDVDKAGKYWVPAEANAWRASAKSKIETMQGGTYTRFFEDLSDGSTPFTVTPSEKPVAGEQTMTSGGTSLDLRQIDGKWYVCKAPL